MSTISQLDLIKDLLHEDFLEKGDNAKVLAEKNLMRRSIVAHHGIDYLLYRYDPDDIKLFPFFSERSGLRKICDYFLFVEEGQHLYLLIIELKLGTQSATNQLIASECFLDYIVKSAKRIGVSLTENLHIKKVRISEKRAAKRNRPTKQRSLEYDVNQIINYDYSDVFRIKEILEVM